MRREMQGTVSCGMETGANLAVDDLAGQVELINHAERNGTAAGLAVVHLALNQEGLDAGSRQRLRSASAGGATAHNLAKGQAVAVLGNRQTTAK